MVTRSCHCQNFVSINSFTINGVAGVAWYFVCSMLHLPAAIKTIPGRASFHFYFLQNSNCLMPLGHGRERYLERHGMA